MTEDINYHEKLKNRKVPFIIGITGDSGSGKTMYSNGLRRFFGPSLVKTFTMDGYHKENREERKLSGKLPLDPAVNRLDLFLEHLKLLKEGKEVDIPVYNHNKGDFDKPLKFSSSPIVIIEGLFTLYPEFLPFIDFSIFTDPTREVKWEWKYERDVVRRHHQVKPLIEEMLKREAAYKRFVDFQKTNANVVIKISESKVYKMARYECISDLPDKTYKVELILEEAKIPLPRIDFPFEMTSIVDIEKPPFLLAAVPSSYWGRKAMVIHIDGLIPQRTLLPLESYLTEFVSEETKNTPNEDNNLYNIENKKYLNPTQVAQLFVAWRFLAQLQYQLM